MFKRLKLSVTWGPINNYSSGISLFLFNLYPQHSIINILEFPHLCRNARYCTTKWHNKEKGESYIPSTNHPPKSTLPSLSEFSSGLFRGLDPNDHPNPYPITAAYPEGRRVQFLNCILPDTVRVGEEALMGVGSWFGPGNGDKLRRAPLGRSDLDLIFFTAYRSIAPICLTSFFSQILLINLAWARTGPATTSFFVLSRSVLSSLSHSPHMILVWTASPCTPPMPLFEETLPRQHPELETWDPQGIETENSKEHGEILERDEWL